MSNKPKLTREQVLASANDLKKFTSDILAAGNIKLPEAEIENIVIQAVGIIGGYQESPATRHIPIGTRQGGKVGLAIFIGGYLIGAGKTGHKTATFADALL